MTTKLHLPEDLAEVLRSSRADVMARVAAGEFPHIRLGRRVRFTDEQIEQITRGLEVAARTQPAKPWASRRSRRSS